MTLIIGCTALGIVIFIAALYFLAPLLKPDVER